MKAKRSGVPAIYRIADRSDPQAASSKIVAKRSLKSPGSTVLVSEATFYNWRAKYGGMQVSEVKRLKELEEPPIEENVSHRRTGRTEPAKRNHQGGSGKKVVRPAQRRAVVRWMIDHKQISQRKACRWVGLSRNAIAEPVVLKEKDQPLCCRIEKLARRYKHWGVLKIYSRLRKQGQLVNHKRVRRLYKILGLSLQRKTKKRLPEAVRQPLPNATDCNECCRAAL